MVGPIQLLPFVLRPELPHIEPSDQVAALTTVTANLFSLRNDVRKAIRKCLERSEASGEISSYTDESDRYMSWVPACQLTDEAGNLVVYDFGQMRLDHLALAGFINLVFVCYQVVIPKGGFVQPPTGVVRYSAHPPFFAAISPWGVLVTQWSHRNLRRSDRIRFGLWIRILFPLVDIPRRPDQATCQHQFILKSLGVWEWRLIWECRLCGYLCHCSCFESAITRDPFTKWSQVNCTPPISVPLTEIPFFPNACEVCRGVPSTNEFCHEMYARSDFERRYGAYVAKRLVESGIGSTERDYEEEKRSITDQLREELGFRRIGERFVSETELFRIVKAIFPTEEVIHHYRAPWLQGLELDIFLPGMKLGIEYHGIQHFEPVSAWGGEDALLKTQERDKKKVKLCEANGVTLVAFLYDEDLTTHLVQSRLNDIITALPSLARP